MTEIIFILDKSGSMTGLEEETVKGFNSMLEKQKQMEDEALISTVMFDSQCCVIHDRVPLNEVRFLTEADYRPRGRTALLDAVGDAVSHIANVHKYARPEDRPETTLVVITTDGRENASQRYSLKKVKSIIRRQQEKYNWDFIFLGANIDAVKEACSFGIKKEKAVDCCPDKEGTQITYEAISEYVKSKRSAYTKSKNIVNADAAAEYGWREKLDKDFKDRGRKVS